MLETLKEKLNKLKVNEDAVWFQVVNRETQFEIIRLNTQDQLFDEGIRADNKSLPDYSNTSVNVYGKRAGHITLKDTGEFYQSFVVKVDKSGIDIVADTQKEDTDLSKKYGNEILGLTDENSGLLREMLVLNYREYIKDLIAS